MEKSKIQLASKCECTGCLTCVDTCQLGALQSYMGTDGRYYVKVDKHRCIGCMKCVKACPVVSNYSYSESEYVKFYAAWNTDDEFRISSASGGVFSAIAQYVLRQGGIVIGAASFNVYDVRHIAISEVSDLSKLQGSKYTQSDTSGIYKKTYELLKDGKMVLFSGTGCQVAGLFSFLKTKRYEGRLITIDLICGGVPSKLLLQKFVENEPYEVKRIISYRTKEQGWRPNGFVYNLKVEDADGKVHDYTDRRNLVTTGFSTELTERYSCYNCKFVGKQRKSDFTIGDLWGDKDFPQEHNKGISLLITHNHQADSFLKTNVTSLHVELCNEVSASKTNFRLTNGKSVKKYTIERVFMEKFFNTCSYQTLKKLYANDYEGNSIWICWKVFRYVYLKLMKGIHN